MFDLFRSRAKAVRYLLGALLLLVAVMLVVTLIPGVGVPTREDSQVVAEIGGETLSLFEVQRNVQAQLRNRSFPQEMASLFVPQIVDRMISEYALAYEAERLGFRVTDADVAAAIQRMIPQLFQDGVFAGRQAYAAMLAERNLTIPQFEQMLRKQLLIEKLQSLAEAGVIVSQRDLESMYRQRFDQVKIEYAVVDPGKLLNQVVINAKDVEEHFQKNQAGYIVPEKRSFQVLIADEAKVASEITVPEAELKRAYEQNKDSYRMPERVRVRHILLKTTDVPKEEIPKVRQKAEDLLKKIRAGADFAELAKKNSEDPGSAAKGGDLDWVVRGQTVKAFEESAFTLKPGQISDLVTTEYGFHILQVLEKQEAHLRPFEEVRGQLADEMKRQKVRDTVERLADQARAQLAKEPQNAERIASSLGLQLVRADKVGSEDPVPEIGVSQELQQALSLLRRNEVTPVVQISPTRLAVAVVTEVFPSHQAELAEVQKKVFEEVLSQKLKQITEQKAKELLAKAEEFYGDLKKAAQTMGFEWKTPPEFSRESAVEGMGTAGNVAEAFRLPVGALFGPVNVNERLFVCKVVGRIPADPEKLAQQRDGLIERIKAERTQEHMELLQYNLRERLVKERKLKINQDVINRLASSYAASKG